MYGAAVVFRILLTEKTHKIKLKCFDLSYSSLSPYINVNRPIAGTSVSLHTSSEFLNPSTVGYKMELERWRSVLKEFATYCELRLK